MTQNFPHRNFNKKHTTNRSSKNLVRTMSKMGLCSRKQAIDLVKNGKVSVNNQIVMDPGRKISPGDKIKVGETVAQVRPKVYLILHKPAGYITTRSDEKGRKTVYDLIPDMKDWVFPVGRLDQDTEGLLLMTNDTEFGNKMTDPKFEIQRVYEVTIQGFLKAEEWLNIPKSGVDIGENQKVYPDFLRPLFESESNSRFEIAVREGKNREVRRIFEALGKKVIRLIRKKFGPYELGDLELGKYREFKIKK